MLLNVNTIKDDEEIASYAGNYFLAYRTLLLGKGRAGRRERNLLTSFEFVLVIFKLKKYLLKLDRNLALTSTKS